MLIEFTGCTGSGKSTILEKVRERLSDSGIETISSVEFIARLIGLRTINNPTRQNITLDIFALPQVILSLKRNFKFYIFVLKILLRKPDSFIGAVNRLRSVMRKIGVNELIRRKTKNDQIVIVDEGTIHSAHNIFVYSSFPIVWKDINTFSHLVPLPDIIVCVKAPKDIILRRTLDRKDLPARFEPKKLMRKYIERALTTFKELASTDKIRQRLFTVDLSDGSIGEINGYVDKIVSLILAAKNYSEEVNSEDRENVKVNS